MKSLKELYKSGRGPSSSHTIGPQLIAEKVLEKHGKRRYAVTLYGSLALTGKGHGTDRVIKRVLGDETEILFDEKEKNIRHPNEMKIYAVSGTDKILLATAQSVGGGAVVINGKAYPDGKDVYKEKNFFEIKKDVESSGGDLVGYVRRNESDVFTHLGEMWDVMKESVEAGLKKDGELNGRLNLERKAKSLYEKESIFENAITRENRILSAYALAVAEENADNGVVVTAPTCGSAGVLPAILYYMYKENNVGKEKIINAMAVAGVIGNTVKQNASISGAECGCQAEIGVACAMAAAALAYLYNLDTETIECAAEIALEHNLGLTCDPVMGYVQIPCIERNAMAANKAVNAVTLAKYLEEKHKIAFDDIVKVMYETGKDMNKNYKETSLGGLASLYK